MKAYWVKFAGAKPGCIEAEDESQAKRLAAQITGNDAASVKLLPYPAEPRLNKYSHPEHGVCPSFCYKPEACHGTCCPQRYSCTE